MTVSDEKKSNSKKLGKGGGHDQPGLSNMEVAGDLEDSFSSVVGARASSK